MEHSQIMTCARIKPIMRMNDEFALVKIYAHGIGKNRNYSYISHEVAERATPSLNYIPVIGHLIPKYNDDGELEGYFMGGHDYVIDWENWTIKPLTVPYGVVIEDSADWEIVEEYGQKVEYRTVYAYLWVGRYPELAEAIYSDDCWFNQSMEINVSDGAVRPLEEDSNYTEILEMTYSALCLLGKSDNPDEHTEPCFISAQVYPVDYSLDRQQFVELMDEMKNSLAHFNLNNNSQKGGSTEDMDNEFNENIEEELDETVDVSEEQFEEEESDIIDDEQFEEEESEESIDESDDESENEEFEEEESPNSLPTEEEYAALLEELEELRAYRDEHEAAARADEYNSVLDEFEDLSDIDEYQELRENALSYESADALRDRCYAIRGKNISLLKFSINSPEREGKVGIDPNADKEKKSSKYGDFYERY